MKAAVHTRYGPPEVVRVVDVPTPAVKANEVLVKVHATTVNRTDCGFRAGKPFFVRALTGLPRPRVTVLGTEFAGTVEAVGHSVASFAVGDRVFGCSGSKGCRSAPMPNTWPSPKTGSWPPCRPS
jgi:NADPH:quinone reductase-like Zn-dependent oxidoreductase